MFGGMPAIQISTLYHGNIFEKLTISFLRSFGVPSGIFLLHLIGFYILAMCLRIKPIIAVFGAFAFALASYEIVIMQAGHNSKAIAMAFMAPVLGAFIMSYRNNWKWGVALSAFFMTWELAGKYPRIFDDKVIGQEAKNLFADAQAMLKDLVDNRRIKANATYGFWPAQRQNDDDIAVFKTIGDGQPLAVLHHLRQQTELPNGKPNLSLADYIAPASASQDYIGGFVVTAGLGADEIAKEYEAAHDDYNAIMVKALADRLAEAFAEHLHERVRKEFWGYAGDESLDNDALIKESYRGIRPAPGYPACPDHTEKTTLFSLLDAENGTGVSLTESMAMLPAASVSGWYFSHPESKYFGVGKVDRDQIRSLARRKKVDLPIVERWLSPALGYEP